MLHRFSDNKAKMTLEGFWCSYFAYNLPNWCPCKDRDGENKQRVVETCPLPAVVWSLTVTCRYEAIWFKRGWICFRRVCFLSRCTFYTPALFFLYSLCVYVFVFALLIQHISSDPTRRPRDSIQQHVCVCVDWSYTCRSTWDAFQTHNFALPVLKSLEKKANVRKRKKGWCSIPM